MPWWRSDGVVGVRKLVEADDPLKYFLQPVAAGYLDKKPMKPNEPTVEGDTHHTINRCHYQNTTTTNPRTNGQEQDFGSLQRKKCTPGTSNVYATNKLHKLSFRATTRTHQAPMCSQGISICEQFLSRIVEEKNWDRLCTGDKLTETNLSTKSWPNYITHYSRPPKAFLNQLLYVSCATSPVTELKNVQVCGKRNQVEKSCGNVVPSIPPCNGRRLVACLQTQHLRCIVYNSWFDVNDRSWVSPSRKTSKRYFRHAAKVAKASGKWGEVSTVKPEPQCCHYCSCSARFQWDMVPCATKHPAGMQINMLPVRIRLVEHLLDESQSDVWLCFLVMAFTRAQTNLQPQD